MRHRHIDINAPDTHHSPGVVGDGSNHAQRQRNYDVMCKNDECIGIVRGYWIWWCSTHHQPQSICEVEKAKLHIKNLEKAIDAAVDLIERGP